MKLVVPKELSENEDRVSITPDIVPSLLKMGFKVFIESNAGVGSSYTNDDYKKSGAKITSSLSELYSKADIVVKVQRPSKKKFDESKFLKNCNIITLLYEKKFKQEFIALKKLNINVFALEKMPRISRAQSMDVLSSQSNLSGYKAVVDAASLFNKAFPLMMTSAGTVAPAKVLIIGAGVAGLQAIATAKRLGAVVSSFDVRASTKEQVESLGAKFIQVDEGKDSGETAGGYAKEMSASYKKKQAKLLEDNVAKTDIIITTALIPGKPAPKLISKKMVDSMKVGSIIIDLASEFGGNCELTKHGEILNYKSKKIVGPKNLPASVSRDSSRLFAKNVINFLMNSCQSGKFSNFNWEDEVVKETCVIRNLKLKKS